jgi:hypothetical protein
VLSLNVLEKEIDLQGNIFRITAGFKPVWTRKVRSLAGIVMNLVYTLLSQHTGLDGVFLSVFFSFFFCLVLGMDSFFTAVSEKVGTTHKFSSNIPAGGKFAGGHHCCRCTLVAAGG